MKRLKQLYYLSWDHRTVLLECFNILKYIKTYSDEETSTKKNSIINLYENDLLLHFRTEEEVLLPRLILKKEANLDLIRKTFDDHLLIHSLIVLLRKEQSDIQKTKSILKELSRTLNDHIRFEERELFQHLQSVLDEVEFNDIENEIFHRYGNKYSLNSCQLPDE